MRSDMIKNGLEKAPHRSLLNALGFVSEELDRPMIGVVNSFNEIVPGHMHLNELTDCVKAGIRLAGGTPVEFPCIAVCDGIAMNHSGMKYSLAQFPRISNILTTSLQIVFFNFGTDIPLEPFLSLDDKID